MNCMEVREQLGDYLDEEALGDLCRAIDEHLRVCPDCRIEVDSLKKTILLYHNSHAAEVPSWTRSKLQRALSDLYRQYPHGPTSR